MHCNRTKTILLTLAAAAALAAWPAAAGATPLFLALDQQAKGLNLSSDGAGTMAIGNGTRTLTVDIGGTVKFARLYWAGRERPSDEGTACTAPFTPYRDQVIEFDGTTLMGAVTGTECQPVSGGGPILNVGYWVDVTAQVAAKGTGSQSFTLADGDTANNLWRWDGASLIVGWIDAADSKFYRVQVFHGLDMAFGNDPTPGDNRTVAPVVFNHGANLAARTAKLHTFSGDSMEDRPDRLEVSNNPTTTNSLDRSSGDRWDSDVHDVDIPAGVGSTTVQYFSDPPNNPDSLVWIAAAMRAPQLDATKPTCPLTANRPGPPAQIEVTFRDAGTGLAEILVTLSENADTVVPPFTVGTNDPVVVTSTKIDQTKRARVEIRATDLAGNVALCDPILALLVREKSDSEVQTYTDVPQAEGKLTIVNGEPGMANFELSVNGVKFPRIVLRDSQKRTVDISGAMHPGDNTVSIKGNGKPGAYANLMIWDGVSE